MLTFIKLGCSCSKEFSCTTKSSSLSCLTIHINTEVSTTSGDLRPLSQFAPFSQPWSFTPSMWFTPESLLTWLKRANRDSLPQPSIASIEHISTRVKPECTRVMNLQSCHLFSEHRSLFQFTILLKRSLGIRKKASYLTSINVWELHLPPQCWCLLFSIL